MTVSTAATRIPRELAECFKANLDALHQAQPDVAAHLQSLPFPAHAVPTAGRDGRPTFRIHHPDGNTAWFGGSSMPAVSAAELVADVPSAGGSILLPTIMTGMEALVLLDRLLKNQAIFILEHESANLVLALHLREYATAIRSGRLFLIPLDIREAAITALFRRWPGLHFPARMFTPPALRQETVREVHGCLAAMNEAASHIQHEAVEQSGTRWRSAAVPVDGRRLRLALIAVGGDAPTSERMEQMAAAGAELDLPYVEISGDDPRFAHPAGALAALANFDPDAVLFLNGLGGAFHCLLPDRVAVVSWLFPEAAIPPTGPPDRTRWPDLTVLPSASCREDWITAGASPHELMICSDALTPVRTGGKCTPWRIDAESWPAIVLVAPTVDDRPEAFQVTLPSHLRLWKRLQEMAVEEIDVQNREWSAATVSRAMQDVGMVGDDPQIIEFFQAVLSQRIAPAAQLRATWSQVQGIERFSACWTPDEFMRHGRCVRAATTSEGVNEVSPAHVAPVVVFSHPFPQRTACILEAVACGITVVLRESLEDWSRRHPDLAEWSAVLAFYDRTADIRTAIHQARQQCADEREKAARIVRTQHALTVRLRDLLAVLQERLERSSPRA